MFFHMAHDLCWGYDGITFSVGRGVTSSGPVTYLYLNNAHPVILGERLGSPGMMYFPTK